MAKNVSTKYGDRRMVYLPPINVQVDKSPDIDSIDPARQGKRQGESSSLPNDFAYGHSFLKIQRRPEGNLVLDKPSPERNVVSERIFEQLIQQANADSLQDYKKGRYPVVPAPEGMPHFMQYAAYGLHNGPQQDPMPPQAQPPQLQAGPPASLAQHPLQPGPPPQCSSCNQTSMPAQPHAMPGNNPNEKHIYYGPDGQVIPGPPQKCMPNIPNRGFTQDFAIEGLLRHGRLTAVNVFDASNGFPSIPDYLLRDLLQKYGQFELTLVRIVARGGQCYVHATPQIPMAGRAPPPPPPPHQMGPALPGQESGKPEYVPVYLEEDEEFDYNKFLEDYKAGKYKAGDPKSFRSMPPDRQIVEYRGSPKNNNRIIPPYRDPVTSDGRIAQYSRGYDDDYRWQYNARPRQYTRAWDTRQDIRPLDSLENAGRYHGRYTT